MRVLFATLQHVESDFYGRVGSRLGELGHEPVHLTYSRRAANRLRARGAPTACLPDLVRRLEIDDLEGEATRICRQYGIPSLRSVYSIDSACAGRPDDWCRERTVSQFLAVERIYAEHEPDVVVPEVGTETMRTAAHLVGLARSTPVLFLFYTLFPEPLRLYVNTMHAPIVSADELRELTGEERADLGGFIERYKRADEPIRPYRKSFGVRSARSLARHVVVRAAWDRDNDYLRPLRWTRERALEGARRLGARRSYAIAPARPYVYFPLHVSDDYKIRRLVPHCADQAALIEQVANSLPDGVELVTKEHPMSVGRTPLPLLRRLRRARNVRVVEPRTSSHELIRHASGVVVIGSTVGLEALMYEKPVLTLGQPFYAGLGVTQDVDSFRELPEAAPALLRFRPDRERVERFLHAAWRSCLPGAPALVDGSDQNARTLASSLDRAFATLAGDVDSPSPASAAPSAQPAGLG